MLTLMFLFIGKTSNYNGALDLWNKMRAKNIKFGKQSKQVFIQLLVLNKVPLPLDIEQ
jgi:pentatricopeptide repeat protein